MPRTSRSHIEGEALAVDVSSGVEASEGIKDPPRSLHSSWSAQCGDELPDAKGHFGPMARLVRRRSSRARRAERASALSGRSRVPGGVEYELKHYVGRPSPVYHARRWSELSAALSLSQARRSDHTGAHKINNVTASAPRQTYAQDCIIAERAQAARRGGGDDRCALRHGMLVYMGSGTYGDRRRTSLA